MEQISIASFEARFDNLKTPMGLVITHARVSGSNVIITPQPLKVEMLQPGAFEAVIDEQSLQVFLDEQAPGGLRNFEVELAQGKINVKASFVMIVPMRVSAICTLRIVDERQIFVDLESVDVLGVAAKGLVEKQLARINPVLDAADLPVDVRLSSVEIVDGSIRLLGTAKPPR